MLGQISLVGKCTTLSAKFLVVLCHVGDQEEPGCVAQFPAVVPLDAGVPVVPNARTLVVWPH